MTPPKTHNEGVRKKKKQRTMFRLYEIRLALQLWKDIWVQDRDITIDWHNFKLDLQDVTRKRKSK